MSVVSLIQERGKMVERRRPVHGVTSTGGVYIAAEDVLAIKVYIQQGRGATAPRYGAERTGYDATGYVLTGTDVKDSDLIDYTGPDGQLRRYRIDGLSNPDERAVNQSLSYLILGLTEDRQVQP